MIDTNYGKEYLQKIFHTDYKEKYDAWEAAATNSTDKANKLKLLQENKIDFPQEVFLALFTTVPVPEIDESGNVIVEYEEPTVDDYARVSLRKEGPKGIQTMAAPKVEEGEVGSVYEGKVVAVVENQDIIVFPENETIAYNDLVKGFGVFDTSEVGTGRPILWGTLTEPAEIKAGEIPVFRVGEFVFKLA